MKLSKKDRLFTKKFLDKMDAEQVKYMEKWLSKSIVELASVDVQNATDMTVSEALVIRMLMEKINKGK